MRQISEGIYGLLVSQGIANGRAGTRANGGIGDGERSRESALSHQPAMREGGPLPMGNSGKGPGVNGPAKFDILTCNGASAHGRRKQATSTHLRLVWSA